jgi:transposase
MVDLYRIDLAAATKEIGIDRLVSIQCNPITQILYHCLKENGKNSKVVVCAIMRKLVHLIFGILKSGKPFDENYTTNHA